MRWQTLVYNEWGWSHVKTCLNHKSGTTVPIKEYVDQQENFLDVLFKWYTYTVIIFRLLWIICGSITSDGVFIKVTPESPGHVMAMWQPEAEVATMFSSAEICTLLASSNTEMRGHIKQRHDKHTMLLLYIGPIYLLQSSMLRSLPSLLHRTVHKQMHLASMIVGILPRFFILVFIHCSLVLFLNSVNLQLNFILHHLALPIRSRWITTRTWGTLWLLVVPLFWSLNWKELPEIHKERGRSRWI